MASDNVSSQEFFKLNFNTKILQDHNDSLLKWANHLDDWIEPNATKLMKISLLGELSTAELERVTRASELFLTLLRVQTAAGKSQEDILSRFIYTLRLNAWGHEATRHLETYKLSKPAQFDDSSQPDDFKLYQCLAKVYGDILENKFCERHIIAYCAAVLETNPKNISDFYALLNILLKQTKLTVNDQTILINALMACQYRKCAEIVQDFREATGQKKIPVNIQELQQGTYTRHNYVNNYF